MRKIKEIIRLKFGVGLSLRAIQQSLNVSYGTVSNYIRRAEQAGLGWPLPPDIDERTVGRLLFPSTGSQGHQGFAELDYVSIYQELKSLLGHQVLAVARIPGALSSVYEQAKARNPRRWSNRTK